MRGDCMPKQRRDKGEGSVFQRKDGKWCAKLTVPNKSTPKHFYGKTESEVKKKLKEFKHELIKNDYREVKKMTLKSYMDDWLYNVKKNELKPKSFDGQEYINNIIYKRIGEMQINNIASDDIQKLINTLVEEEYSHSLIKKVYDSINACFKRGLIKETVIKNPCVGVSLPKNLKKDNSKEIIFFNAKEIAAICKECVAVYNNGKSVHRLGYAIIVFLYCGMRIGELLGLKWEYIDFKEKKIKITETVATVIDRSETATAKFIALEQDSTKTRAGDRIIPMNKKVIEALQEIRKINPKSTHVMAITFYCFIKLSCLF